MSQLAVNKGSKVIKVLGFITLIGVIAVVIVAIATYLAYRLAERERGLKSRELF